MPPPGVSPQVPSPNPSSSLVLPPAHEVPVSPVNPGTGSGSTFATGNNLAGTNQVVNPAPGVFHAHHHHRYHHY
jgi:hypothetical protein